MSIFSLRRDPGECPVCGAAHSICTAGDKDAAIVVQQLPARDRAPGSRTGIDEAHVQTSGELDTQLEHAPGGRHLGPTEFTTRTYDRNTHGRKGRRR